MRSIIKELEVKRVIAYVYNKETKQEETLPVEMVIEIEKNPKIPANYVLIEFEEIDEVPKVKRYRMTPQQFIEHAEIV